jgi:hypothetical protein
MVGMNLLLAEVSFAMDKILTLIWIVPSEWELQLLPVLVFLELSYNRSLLSFNIFGVLKYLYPPLQQMSNSSAEH